MAFTLIIGAFGVRLLDLQLSPDPALSEGFSHRYRQDELVAPRGRILDRRGRSLAVSLPSPTIVADPRLVADHEVEAVVAQLAPLVSTSPEVLSERLDWDKQFAYVERQVDAEVGEAVMALGIRGIRIDSELRREHPVGECSGLGVVGRVDVDHKGISGLELAYDESLTGTNGRIVREASSNGRITIPEGHEIIQPAVPGEDLRLTLDRNVQFRAEHILADHVAAAAADSGMVVISIPATGEVIAAASVTRDPRTGFVTCSTTNHALVSSYEPGSIMKPITMAAVLDAGLVMPHEPVNLPEELIYDIEDDETKSYVDWFDHTKTHYSATEIMVKSSNIGVITLANRLGPHSFDDVLHEFGFGASTALNFRGESAGILRDLASNLLELPAVSIGQSIAVTSIQMLQAFNVIANGGVFVDPVLLVDDIGAGETRRVVSEEAAADVMEMMRAVVSEGTGKLAAVDGYDVAGKTGTAWQPCGDDGGYDCDGLGSRHYTPGFVGIVSNDDGPALSILVVIDNPQGGSYGGGAIAAPAFAEIAADVLPQLQIPPLGASTVSGRVRAQPAVGLAAPAGGAGEQVAQQ